MDKNQQCFEHIKTVCGVNRGAITEDLIEILFERYSIDQKEKLEIYDLLTKNNITVKAAINDPPINNKTKKENVEILKPRQDDLEMDLRRKENFNIAFDICMQKIQSDPLVAKQYKKELIILKTKIREKEKISNAKPIQIILHGIIELSKQRIGYTRKMGWICGTYISHVKDGLEQRLERMFSQKELEEFVQSCAHKEVLSERQYKMLLVFIDITPKIIINRFCTNL